MLLAAIVAVRPSLQAVIHAGLQIEAGRQAEHPDLTQLAAVELEGEIGGSNGLPELVVAPFDIVLERGHVAMRDRAVGLAPEFRAGEIMSSIMRRRNGPMLISTRVFRLDQPGPRRTKGRR
jgi:hypothetical protein